MDAQRGVKEIIAANNQNATRQGNTEIIKQALPNEDNDQEGTEVSVSYCSLRQTHSSRHGHSSTLGGQSFQGEEVFINPLKTPGWV